MTNSEKNLVKQSWKMIRDIDPVIIGDAFYSKLFSDNPSLRKMFPADMQAQYKKLVFMLKYIVADLDNPEEFISRINELSVKHETYQLKPAHYAMVGKALIWTLKTGLGKDWTPSIEAAWVKCYQHLSDAMMAHAIKG